MSKVQLLLDVIEDLRSLADSIQAVAQAIGQNDAPAEPSPPKAEIAPPAVPAPPPAKKVTLTEDQVRAVLSEKTEAGKTAEVRALLVKYGAPKLSLIDPKHYEALLKDAEVL